ncbi:unnamed protein product, partial [Brassica oleracea]
NWRLLKSVNSSFLNESRSRQSFKLAFSYSVFLIPQLYLMDLWVICWLWAAMDFWVVCWLRDM